MNKTITKKKQKRRALPLFCKILGITFILAVVLTALPLSLPRLFGCEIYNVESGSMVPALPVGSVIYVKNIAPEEIAEGDIISFQREGTSVTHRVVENHLVEGKFTTKGDANEKEDINPVPYTDYIGKVVFHFPLIGKFLLVYSSGLGKFYVLLVAACGIMLNILGSMLKKD